jgi:hypothetical protein
MIGVECKEMSRGDDMFGKLRTHILIYRDLEEKCCYRKKRKLQITKANTKSLKLKMVIDLSGL